MTGADVKALRTLNGMSQAAFGEALGVSRIAVNTWENDRFQPPKDLLAQMAAKHLLIRQLDTTLAWGFYDLQRRELSADHWQALAMVQRGVDEGSLKPLTNDDRLMIASRYPDIFKPK